MSDTGSESEKEDALEHMTKHELHHLVTKSGCCMLAGRNPKHMTKEEMVEYLVKCDCPVIKKMVKKKENELNHTPDGKIDVRSATEPIRDALRVWAKANGQHTYNQENKRYNSRTKKYEYQILETTYPELPTKFVEKLPLTPKQKEELSMPVLPYNYKDHTKHNWGIGHNNFLFNEALLDYRKARHLAMRFEEGKEADELEPESEEEDALTKGIKLLVEKKNLRK